MAVREIERAGFRHAGARHLKQAYRSPIARRNGGASRACRRATRRFGNGRAYDIFGWPLCGEKSDQPLRKNLRPSGASSRRPDPRAGSDFILRFAIPSRYAEFLYSAVRLSDPCPVDRCAWIASFDVTERFVAITVRYCTSFAVVPDHGDCTRTGRQNYGVMRFDDGIARDVCLKPARVRERDRNATCYG